MPSERDTEVLRVLKQELVFLESGGYRHPERAKWRAQFVFEDSPTCLNSGDVMRSIPCKECSLFAYVPEEGKQKQAPCRHIPLNAKKETLDSLYRTATPEEIEATVAAWLRTEIERLKEIQKKGASHAASAS
jgi:uncharacterized small protein (DUF1192 family)